MGAAPGELTMVTLGKGWRELPEGQELQMWGKAWKGQRDNTEGKAKHRWAKRWWQLWQQGQGLGPAQLLHKDRPSALPRDLPGKRKVKQPAPGFRELRVPASHGGMGGWQDRPRPGSAWQHQRAGQHWRLRGEGTGMAGDREGLSWAGHCGGCEGQGHGRKAGGQWLWGL